MAFVFDENSVGKILVDKQIVRQLDGFAEVQVTAALHERQAVHTVYVVTGLAQNLVRVQLRQTLHERDVAIFFVVERTVSRAFNREKQVAENLRLTLTDGRDVRQNRLRIFR